MPGGARTVTYKGKGIFGMIRTKDNKLSAGEMHDFTRVFDSGRFHPSWRYGQAFINHHRTSLGIQQDPETFYADRKKAEKRIWEVYVEQPKKPPMEFVTVPVPTCPECGAYMTLQDHRPLLTEMILQFQCEECCH
jgi:hypothetical protein